MEPRGDVVHAVAAAISFYCGHLGFTERMYPAPRFAMLTRGGLRLLLSAPGGGPGGGAAVGGVTPEPGGVKPRGDVVHGVGGDQVLVEDPSGNPVELFQPTRDEARLKG